MTILDVVEKPFKNIKKKYEESEAGKKLVTYMKDLGIPLTFGLSLPLGLTKHGVLGFKFEALIGGIPIQNVTYFDMAESDSVVKYRAFGGEYFAHQGGDKFAMRIDFLTVPPEKEYLIPALRFLRLISQSKITGDALSHTDESFLFDPINYRTGEGLWTFKRVKKKVAKTAYVVDAINTNLEELSIHLAKLYNKSVDQMRQDLVNLRIKMGVPGSTLTDKEMNLANRVSRLVARTTDEESFIGVVPSSNVNPLSIQRVMESDILVEGLYGTDVIHSDKFYELQKMGYRRSHLTFPIIVENMIFTNMWIETFQFTHDSRDGVDAIIGHILLRKYDRPPKLRWTASGRNISRLYYKINQKEDKSGNYTVTQKPLDKWVWVWEEKKRPTERIVEISAEATIGMIRISTIYSKKPGMYLSSAGLLKKDVKKIEEVITL